MIFNDYIELNSQFQNSINLNLDLKNHAKINTYIPTTTGNQFLKSYIDDVLLPNRDKSTMLIAPYGKGKSHAILVLQNLLQNTNYEKIFSFIENIKSNDIELYNRIERIKSKKYLPVIISHTRGTLNSSLMNSLNKALVNNELNNIKLETDYTQAIDRILNWKKLYPEVYLKYVNELKKNRLKDSNFIKRLSHYDEESYNLFCKIHKTILAGVEFTPISSLEVVDYYQAIKNKLVSDYGYDGIYIVFDEFSKFIESRDRDISNEMKIIQDIAELCNSSTDNSMYFLMVLHKPINAYRSLNIDIKNAFKGIEGRVSSYYFKTTVKNSFELVFNAIKKNEKYKNVAKKNAEINQLIVNSIKKIPAFTAEFDLNFIENELVNNCYPLNPITLYLLIRISERVAQNERTLFTFLIKESENSLSKIIKQNYKYDYIMPSLIFDYFKNVLIEDEDNIQIHRIAMSAITALDYADDDIEKELIKSLALILMINEKTMLASNDENISASLLINTIKCKEVIASLINKNVLVRRRDGNYEFKVNINRDIQLEINNLSHTKFSRIRISEELNKLNANKYVYPKVYNTQNAITRYFKVEYIDEDAFLALDNLNEWFVQENNDGLILNIIRSNGNNQDRIQKYVELINNPRLLVVYPNQKDEYDNLIKNIKSVVFLLENNISEDKLMITELDQILKDLKSDLNEKLERNYSIYDGDCLIYNSYDNNSIQNVVRALSKERILGNILSYVFNRSPIVNLELLNKENVKSTYRKARLQLVSNILKGYLNDEDCLSAKTSPMDTIINCLLVETGIKPYNEDKIRQSNFVYTLNEIDDFFSHNNGNFMHLYATLTREPYGIRRGIIPILLALKIRKLNQLLIIYYKDREVDIDEELLERINDDPSSYSYKIDTESNEKSIYLEELANLFEYDLSKANNYSYASSHIQSWYHNLPKLTKHMIGKDDVLKETKYKRLKKVFSSVDINASEFILEMIPRIFQSENYNIIADLRNVKEQLESYTKLYSIRIKKIINSYLGYGLDVDVKNVCTVWINENKNILDKKILSHSYTSFINMFSQNNELTSEYDIINTLPYYLTGLFIEDWSSQTIALFENQLKELINIVSEDNNESNEIILNINGKKIIKTFSEELDDSAEMIENIITDAIDDLGDSISTEQKIALLVKIMEKYI